MKGELIWFLLVVLLILFPIGMKLIQSFHYFAQQEKVMSSFSPHLPEYLNNQWIEKRDAEPYLLGKAVTIDVDQKAVDEWTYPKLPDAIRALTPDEVGTVVQIKWDREKVGATKRWAQERLQAKPSEAKHLSPS